MLKNYLGLNISHKPFKYNSLSDIFSIVSSFAGNSKWQLTVKMRLDLHYSYRYKTPINDDFGAEISPFAIDIPKRA